MYGTYFQTTHSPVATSRLHVLKKCSVITFLLWSFGETLMQQICLSVNEDGRVGSLVKDDE